MSFLMRRAFVAVTAAMSMASAAVGQTIIAGWTIPTAFPIGPGNVPTGTSYLPPSPNGAGVANLGANFAGSQLISVHSLAATSYISPSGNGSSHSFSSNNWSPGDYYQVTLSTAGFTNLSISWDQARNLVGPAAFRLLVSTNGGASFVDLMSYTVLVSGSTGPSTWIPNTYNPIYTRTVSVTDEVDLTDHVIFRFQNFEPLASLASGSTHIDNIVVTGVPTPGAVAVLGLAGLAVGRRRR